MTALESIGKLCLELDRRGVQYTLRIDRDEALMMEVAVPGQRWEVEYFDDGRCEVEIFTTEGVTDGGDLPGRLLVWFDE